MWFEETAPVEVILTLETCADGKQEAMRQAAPRHEQGKREHPHALLTVHVVIELKNALRTSNKL